MAGLKLSEDARFLVAPGGASRWKGRFGETLRQPPGSRRTGTHMLPDLPITVALSAVGANIFCELL